MDRIGLGTFAEQWGAFHLSDVSDAPHSSREHQPGFAVRVEMIGIFNHLAGGNKVRSTQGGGREEAAPGGVELCRIAETSRACPAEPLRR